MLSQRKVKILLKHINGISPKVNELRIEPILLTQLGRIKADEYRSTWADITIINEISRTTSQRRKATLLAFEEWFENFSDEWTANHVVQLNDEVGFDHLLLHRQTYQTHLVDITLFYPTNQSTTPAQLTLPYERLISRLSMVEYLEDFCSKYARLVSETFFVDALKLMNKIIQIFGPKHKIMKGASNQSISDPHICFKIEFDHCRDYFVAVAFIAPLR